MIFRRAIIVLPALIAVLAILAPAASAQPASFPDVEGTAHEDAVFALASKDIINGCEDGRFCAREELTRGQGATIIAAALDLPPVTDGTPSSFTDTADSTHRASIDAVAAARLVAGCGDDRFCPEVPITREQLASVLHKAFDVPAAPEGVTYFADVKGIHAPAINAITAAGIGSGCELISFCSTDNLQRAHAAMFFARALNLVERVELSPYDGRKAEHDEQVAAELAEREAAAKEAAEEEAAAQAAAEAAASAPGNRAVEVAMDQLGKPYAWGGSGPSSFDCSGLTSYAWRAAGVELPRTSSAQYSATTRVSRSELRPGDLVFYHSPISHVAMYIGDGRVVESPNSGNNVRIREEGLTRSGIVGYGRP